MHADLKTLLKVTAHLRAGDYVLDPGRREELAAYFEEMAAELRGQAKAQRRGQRALTPTLSLPEQLATFIKTQNKGERIYLSDVRASVSQATEKEWRDALVQLMLEGLVVAYPADLPSSLTAKQRQGAVLIAGEPHHFLYRL